MMKITHVSKPASCQGPGGVRPHPAYDLFTRAAASERASQQGRADRRGRASIGKDTREPAESSSIFFTFATKFLVRSLFYFPAGGQARRNTMVATNYTYKDDTV